MSAKSQDERKAKLQQMLAEAGPDRRETPREAKMRSLMRSLMTGCSCSDMSQDGSVSTAAAARVSDFAAVALAGRAGTSPDRRFNQFPTGATERVHLLSASLPLTPVEVHAEQRVKQ